ncbi:MAG: type II secretion system protein, partial [Verrucomicrobia bacterium]|nr:type II secretion system protein [Verrucomicrobiota bacterium]
MNTESLKLFDRNSPLLETCDASRFSVSVLGERCLPPHPGPLPRGEGELDPAREQADTPKADRRTGRATLSVGRGQGEGNGGVDEQGASGIRSPLNSTATRSSRLSGFTAPDSRDSGQISSPQNAILRYGRLQICATTNAAPRCAGFTMVEIALSLAIIAFALVAIIGVLPAGVKVQQENREETVINQDGLYLLEAIRTGSK